MANPNQQFRIAEIDVSRTTADDHIAGIFRLEQAGTSGRGPSLIIVADIRSSLYVYERLLDLLSETAEQARHLVSGVAMDPVARFEKLIQRLNEALQNFAAQEANPPQWKRANLFVIELTEGHLCFTGVGTLMNAFFQKQADRSFRSFDLLGSLEQPVEPDPNKPFASIVCGDINPGDVLILGTNNLERLRSDLQVKERLTTLPPVTAALDIQHDLEHRGIPDHFVAAVISCIEAKPVEATPPTQTAKDLPVDYSTASIEKLRTAEEETTQHLAPTISPVPKRFVPTQLASTLSGAFGSIQSRISDLFFRSWKKTSHGPNAVAFASLRSMNAGYGSFFTKKRKTLIGTICAVVVLLGIGIGWWRHAQNVAAETALWNATYDSATDQRNRAESDLIYGNDARAKTEIASVEQAIASLPTNTSDRKTRIDKLKADLTGFTDRLKKIVKSENLTELTSLGAASDNQLVAPVITSDNAYVADNSTGSILKISIASKTVKHIELPNGSGAVISGTEGKDSIIFATSNGKLLTVSKSGDAVSSLAWAQTRTSSTTDIVLYGSKLYNLDPDTNQVWRSVNTGSGFGPESAYIKATSAPISNAVSMAIDSSVYILKNDGTVIRFLSGGQEGFALAPIDPPLRAASGIWTKADVSSVVITDPADKRVVVFDKDGNLTSQIISSQFTTPRDVSADDTNKRMIVVDGNRLLLVPMP